jgi:hypothetical protein
MKSQNATATIESASACTGDTVLVAVDVMDFINVGAMTIFIGYDTSNAQFLSVANTNPAIPGFLTVNANNGQVGIAYSNISGFTITNDKLFDLEYILQDNSTTLTFNPGTEIANTNLVVIPLDTTNGGIYNGIEIIDQPDSVQAYPDTDASFTFLVSGTNIDYQWEENSGSGWVILQNNTTYSGVNSETLTVHDLSLGFDGNTYRCFASKGNCEQYSEIALLEVNTAYPAATIGQVTSCPEQTILSPVFVGDFYDVIEFIFNISYDDDVVEFISLENIHPDLQNGTINTELLINPAGVSITWEDTDPVSVTSGKLFDLKFTYMDSNTSLAFATGTQVINSLSNPVNITLTNGYVYQHELPLILTQPINQTVQQFNDAVFNVEATGAAYYQWQLSMDNGQNWDDLTNGIPYYNTTTNELTISPVTWNLNGYLYSCLVANEFCEIRSESATLNVDTLTWTGKEINTLTEKLRISPNPANDRAMLSFNCEKPSEVEVRVISLNGQVVETMTGIRSEKGINHEIIDVNQINPGLYMVEVLLWDGKSAIVQRTKLIKIFN